MVHATYPTGGLQTIDTPINVDRLDRFFQIERALMLIQAAKLPDIETWAVKQQIGYHLREDMEHADALRRRRQELPRGRSDAGEIDPDLWRILEGCLHLQGDAVFCSALYLGFKPMLVAGYREHLQQSTSVSDRPSRLAIEPIASEHERQIAWMSGAVALLAAQPRQRSRAAEMVGQVQAWVSAAGGILGQGEKQPGELPAPRPYEMNKDPRREPRQRVTFEFEFPDAIGQVDGEVVKLFTGFFREMAAAESVAQILWDAPRNMPWEFYVDSARHCWDEIRHCQAGQERLEALGFDIWSVPVQTGSYSIRSRMNVLERYALLTQIQEKGAFGWKHASERHFRDIGDSVSADMVAYDISDETAHVKYGVKWIPRMQEVIGDARSVEQLVADSDASCQALTDTLRRQYDRIDEKIINSPPQAKMKRRP